MNQPGRYALQFLPAAARSIRKLPREVAARIKTTTESLRINPRPHGAKPLTGRDGTWRVRVGDYRVVYEIRDGDLVVLVVRVAREPSLRAVNSRT